jgi:hypothetical protein
LLKLELHPSENKTTKGARIIVPKGVGSETTVTAEITCQVQGEVINEGLRCGQIVALTLPLGLGESKDRLYEVAV